MSSSLMSHSYIVFYKGSSVCFDIFLESEEWHFTVTRNFFYIQNIRFEYLLNIRQNKSFKNSTQRKKYIFIILIARSDHSNYSEMTTKRTTSLRRLKKRTWKLSGFVVSLKLKATLWKFPIRKLDRSMFKLKNF